MKKELPSGEDRSRQRRTAFWLLATMFFAALSAGCVGRVAAQDSKRYPVATGWSEEGGYQFDQSGDFYFASQQSFDKETNELIGTRFTVNEPSGLCVNSPNAPICESILGVAETYGLEEKQVEELSNKLAILPGSYLPYEVCRSEKALGCQLVALDKFSGDVAKWMVMAGDSLNNQEMVEMVASHEIFHWLLPRLEEKGPLETVATDETWEQKGCLRWFVDKAEICESRDEGKTTCSTFEYSELEAVIASRVYMVRENPECWNLSYVKEHPACSGGYSGIYDFVTDDDLRYLSRNTVYANITNASGYFFDNPDEYRNWIALKIGGKSPEANELLIKAMGREELSAENRLRLLSQLDASLRFYTTDLETPFYTEETYGKPVNEICR